MASKDRYHPEPYELSQDLIAKQLEVLEKKYGGPRTAKEAAQTIQRAFRRYSMAKKFEYITQQVKTEKRISRLSDFQINSASTSAGLGVMPLTSNYHHHHHHHHHHFGHHEVLQHQASLDSAGVTLRHSRQYHNHHRQQLPLQQPPPPPTQHAPTCRHRIRSPSAGPSAEPKQSPSPVNNFLSVDHDEAGNDDTDSSSNSNTNLCPSGRLVVPAVGHDEFQSFPLDETSVYSHRMCASCQQPTKLKATGSDSQLVRNNRDASPHSASKRRPDVPKRTVSRLTNTETVNNNTTQSSSSKLQPSPSSTTSSNSSHHSSPQFSKSTRRPLQQPSSHSHLHHPVRQDITSNFSPSGHCYTGDVDVRLTRLQPYRVPRSSPPSEISNSYTVNEVIRKRHYRTGLNIFNKKPDKGIAYLIRRGFLENSPQAVARFLITRKGLSKHMIGEYLGNLMYPFNMAVLNCFTQEMDFSGMQVDTALRKFQTYFLMPGEAQKIERLMEVFSGRYIQCNPDIMTKFHNTDTVFILAFAIILLNTDLHTPNIKPEKRMKLEDFVRNLRQIDEGHDLDHEMLSGIYERIRAQQFRPGSDHVTQVMKVQQTIVAKCPNLAVPHRRLVCYCRLYEVMDPHKKERPGLHQREVFLFNDLLVITKIHSRKKNTVTYTFRQSYLLAGMVVTVFETQFYPYGIQMSQKWDRKIVLTLNARNEHDRSKFVEDLRESVAEMDEMEALRLEAELEKQRLSVAGSVDNRDSGIAEGGSVTGGNSTETTPTSSTALRHHASNGNVVTQNGVVLRKSAINNSLLDLADSNDKMARRGSVGSLDSGMSISFQSNSVGSMCLPAGSVDPRHCYHNHNHYHRGGGGGTGGGDKRLYHS